MKNGARHSNQQYKINNTQKKRSEFMSINQNIRNILPDEAIICDNPSFDNAIIGVTSNNCVVYDYNQMIAEMMIDDGCSYEDAVDWIDYNTIRSLPYTGENAPIIMYKL